MEEGKQRMFASITEYDDGTLDRVIAMKLAQIARLENAVEEGDVSRDTMVLLRTLIEDSMLYNMVRDLVTSTEDEFEEVLARVLPAFDAELTDLPRSVMDNYRRRLTDEELMLEDRAAGFVDDIRGIATGRCGS